MVQIRSKQNQNEKGITLVALVITIVVLLILAGVSIITLFDDNGIINSAKKAKEETEKGVQNDINGLNSLMKELDKYAKESDGTENVKLEDYKDVIIALEIEPTRPQKASYLMTWVDIKELDDSENVVSTMKASIGTDGTFEVKENPNNAFLPKTFSMNLKLTENPTKYQDIGTFRNLEIKGKLKKNTKYKVELHRMASKYQNGEFSLYDRLGEELVLEKDQTSIKNSYAHRCRFEFTGDSFLIADDEDAFKLVFSKLSDTAVIDYFEQRKFINLMDSNGDPMKGMEKYIGFDLTCKGYIDYDDYKFITIAGIQGW